MFKINEVVVLLASTQGAEFIGEDVIIKSGLTYRESRINNPVCINVYAHLVEFPDGQRYWCSPECLGKKKPSEEKIDWVKMCKLNLIDKREIA